MKNEEEEYQEGKEENQDKEEKEKRRGSQKKITGRKWNNTELLRLSLSRENLLDLFYIVCLSVLSAKLMCITCMANNHKSQKRASDPLRLELQTVVSHYVGETDGAGLSLAAVLLFPGYGANTTP